MATPISYPNSKARNARVLIESYQLSLEFAGDSIDHKSSLGDRIVFFTDGSYYPWSRVGGAGVTFKRFPATPLGWTDENRGLLGVYGSTDSELAAIGLALEIAYWEIFSSRRRPGYSDQAELCPDIYIITDCQDALHCISYYLYAIPEDPDRYFDEFMDPVFKEVAYNLDRLAFINAHVEFRWVKGHNTSRGNKRADQLAKDASQWIS